MSGGAYSGGDSIELSDNRLDTEDIESPYGAAWGCEPSDEPTCGNETPSVARSVQRRPMCDWRGEVRYTPKDGRQQRGTVGGDGNQDTEKYDSENTLSHNPEGADFAETPSATVATGLGKRQYKLHEGGDVKAPDENGEWFDTTDGERESTEKGVCRAKVEAPMQQVGVPRIVQERVYSRLEDETGKAWSFAGGWIAAAVGVLAALGYRGYAEAIVGLESEYQDESGEWHRRRPTKGYGVDRLQEHAEKRGLVI